MDGPEPPDAKTTEESLDVAEARPGADEVAHAVVRARAASALFGVSAAVTVGRYRVLAKLGRGGGGEVWSAFDPELDRRVALKMIDTTSSAALRERVKAEGQALARLAHPNVVPVHDVLEHGEHVVLVMELVDGQTLRAWAAEGHKARDVVRAYRQLADGLAAMHAAGLVHRDVKPDNAMVGADGRVRVVDLGLALAADAGPGAAGKVAGTPRYMAPEQAAGEAITASVDQYGLCVSLREALTQRGRAVPAWVAPVLDRGAAADPAARFPSMDALASALAADPARRRRGVAIAAAGVAAVGVAFVIGRSAGAMTRAASPACDGGAAGIAKVWNDTLRVAVRERLAAGATPYSYEATPVLVARLDDYAVRWSGAFDSACRARTAGELSPTLAERRAGCLASSHAALGAVAQLTMASTAGDVPDLAQAAAALPSLERCADDAALLADVEPPPPDKAAAAAALSGQLAVTQVHVDAARIDATDLAATALATARALAHPPLLARALVLDGRARRDTDDHGAARFAEAVEVALAAHDDHVAVEAFARQVWAATTGGGAGTMPDGVTVIERLAARLPGDAFPRALLANNRGVAALTRGDRDVARLAFTDALELTRGVAGPGAVELLVVRANLALVTDDAGERTRLLEDLLQQRTAALGPIHPRTLDTRIMQGMLTADLAAAARILEGACNDLSRFHPHAGSDLAECWYELALVSSGDDAAVRAALDRVVATEAVGGEPARIVLARAKVASLDGRYSEADAGFTSVITMLGDPGDRWWISILLGEAYLGRALVSYGAGRSASAARDAAQATKVLSPIQARQRLPWIARRATVARALTMMLTNPPGSP